MITTATAGPTRPVSAGLVGRLMPLSVERERRFPIAIVRLRGELDRASAPMARAAMLKALAEQPSALVIDLSELRATDEITLVLFAAVAARAARWPATPVMLVAPTPGLGEALCRRAASRHLRVYPSAADALDAARQQPVPRRVTIQLRPTIEAATSARSLAVSVCRRWGLTADACDIIELVVSELVANGVRHAGTPIDLSLQLSGNALYVSCRDRSNILPVARTAGVDDEHGRGLQLVGAMVNDWGSAPTTDGKVVWACLRPLSGPSR